MAFITMLSKLAHRYISAARTKDRANLSAGKR
jgi:hypothetical protein